MQPHANGVDIGGIDVWAQILTERMATAPWLWDLPPNDRRYSPVYVACIEAGVPFCTQVGHTGPLRRSETGRLIPYLEDVLLDFPELVVVGGHVGFPWLDELTSPTVKFPNLHVDTSAYATHRLPRGFAEYMTGVGQGRVMFGTGAFPLRGRSTGPPSDRGRRDEGAGCGWLRAGT